MEINSDGVEFFKRYLQEMRRHPVEGAMSLLQVLCTQNFDRLVIPILAPDGRRAYLVPKGCLPYYEVEDKEDKSHNDLGNPWDSYDEALATLNGDTDA